MLEFEISGHNGSDRDVESGARRRERGMETDQVQLALDDHLLFMFVRASGVESRPEPTYTGPELGRGATSKILSRWLPVAVVAASLAVWGLVWLLFG